MGHRRNRVDRQSGASSGVANTPGKRSAKPTPTMASSSANKRAYPPLPIWLRALGSSRATTIGLRLAICVAAAARSGSLRRLQTGPSSRCGQCHCAGKGADRWPRSRELKRHRYQLPETNDVPGLARHVDITLDQRTLRPLAAGNYRPIITVDLITAERPEAHRFVKARCSFQISDRSSNHAMNEGSMAATRTATNIASDVTRRRAPHQGRCRAGPPWGSPMRPTPDAPQGWWWHCHDRWCRLPSPS